MSRTVRRLSAALLLVAALPGGGAADSVSVLDKPIELVVSPGAGLPVGRFGPYLGAGGGGGLGLAFRPWKSPLTFGLTGRFGIYPLDSDDGSIESYVGGATIGARLRTPRLRFSANAALGAAQSVLRMASDATPELDLAYSLDAGVGYHFSRSIFADLRLAYTGILRLYQGIGASVGVGFALGSPGRYFSADLPEPDYSDGVVGLSGLAFDRVFPVLHKHYDQHPLGSVALTNWGEQTITNVAISLNVPAYMAAPRAAVCPVALDPGESVTVPMNALFTEDILAVTADTKVSAVVAVTYTIAREQRSFAAEKSIEVAVRNALTWDDDRKAAAFVSGTDPVVATLARSIVGTVREAGYDQVSENVRLATGLFEGLRLLGAAYVPDPNTPYSVLSRSSEAVDNVQFPRHTLESRVGDCDDLSVCYCSMLESAGIGSALIMVPGHVLPAFDSGLTVEEARRRNQEKENLIIHGGTVWIPVEATAVRDGFGYAWAEGAKLWREHQAAGTGELIPVAEAWASYAPVGLPDTGTTVRPPEPDALLPAFADEMDWYVRSRVEPRLAAIRARIESAGESARDLNALGVAYAQFDLLGDARTHFERALEIDSGYVPALVNLGNALLLGGAPTQALEHFLRAADLDENNPAVRLGLSRAYHELEDYAESDRQFRALAESDPETAARYPYLDRQSTERARASDIQRQRRAVTWEEDE